MTTEIYVENPTYTIAGTGPYAVVNPYNSSDELDVTVIQGSDVTLLAPGTEWTAAPDGSETTGDVTLDAAAATTYAGATLVITRRTRQEQGWSGLNPRERLLGNQLDRTMRSVQDQTLQAARALKVPSGEGPAVVLGDVGTVLQRTSAGFGPGPTSDEIAAAQGHAEDAGVSAAAAAASAAAAAVSAAEAEAAVYDPAAVAITGGGIDGTVIGATTPAPATFTSIATTDRGIFAPGGGVADAGAVMIGKTTNDADKKYFGLGFSGGTLGAILKIQDLSDAFGITGTMVEIYRTARARILPAGTTAAALDGDLMSRLMGDTRYYQRTTDVATLADAQSGTGTGLMTAERTGQVALGVNQTWQNVLGSRASSTSYQNTTGRPIMVAIRTSGGVAAALEVSQDNTTWIIVGGFPSTGVGGDNTVVPADWYYRCGHPNITDWAELR